MTKGLAQILGDDPDFFTSERLSVLTENDLREKVFKGLDNFPLVDERARLLREVGIVIGSEGSFTNFMEKTEWNLPKFVKQLVEKVSGFRDEAIYRGKQVYFYKRAQILAVDLALSIEEHPEFVEKGLKVTGEEEITMFPDYRVPQVLRMSGILEYSE
jgi:hypothetical protein